ncbi:MAG TPA: hypothetical protein VE991_02420 [Acidimicrobiales bacterium]|nr:hypothetical protein [Acidimicrobiales bacterium]
MTIVEQPLVALDLPPAPPVVRAVPSSPTRSKGPAVGLLVVGVLLVVAPVAAGLFSKAAAGKQMIDEFAPHMTAGTLARYGDDLRYLDRAAAAVDSVYAAGHVATGAFPILDTYRTQSAAINRRAADLLDRVGSTAPDYRRVAAVGGFERIPFLLEAFGILALYAGCVLLFGRRGRGAVVVLVLTAALALAVYPFLSGLERSAAPGHRMLGALAPVMTPASVAQLQEDFVVLVEADGALDTTFRPEVPPGPAAADIGALVGHWPRISSDLASLVGAVNDNIGNYDALRGLDRLSEPLGVPGLVAFPWLLVATGGVGAALAVAARPKRRGDT